MRHDPAGASIVIMLRSLKLYGMAQAVDALVAQGAPAFEAATPMLSQLLKAEMAEREVRSIAYQTKVARFPSYKDLAGFDFKSSEVHEATVRQLHRGAFMENAENIVLIGGSGTGKSHIATALGVQAIELHRCKVRFDRAFAQVLPDSVAGQARSPRYLADWHFVTQCPASSNTQKSHVDHSISPRPNPSGQRVHMGQCSVKILGPTESLLS